MSVLNELKKRLKANFVTLSVYKVYLCIILRNFSFFLNNRVFKIVNVLANWFCWKKKVAFSCSDPHPACFL